MFDKIKNRFFKIKSYENSTKVIIFHHALKTGGTSLSNWFNEVFAETNEATIHLNVEDEDTLANLPSERMNKIQVVHGHGAYHAIKYFKNVINITVVREPVSFALSRYVFDRDFNIKNPQLNNLIQPLHDDLPISDLSKKILEWCQGPVYNTYASMYVPQALLINPKLKSELSLKEEDPILEGRFWQKRGETDIKKIMSAYDYVWTTENLEMLCHVLTNVLNLPKTYLGDNVNTKPNYPMSFPIRFSNSTFSSRFYLPNKDREKINELSGCNDLFYKEALFRSDKDICDFFNDSSNKYQHYLDFYECCANYKKVAKVI